MLSRTVEVISPIAEGEKSPTLSVLGVDTQPGSTSIYEYNAFNQMVKALISAKLYFQK